MKALAIVALKFGLGALLVVACSSSPDVNFEGAPALLERDGGKGEAGSISQNLCPVTECPGGRDTCPGGDLCGTKLLSDSQNCGACGNVCPELGDPDFPGYFVFPLNAQSRCIEGRCTLACPTTFLDCNGRIEDGCEADTTSDANNCGSCTRHCDAGVPCIGGECGCLPGQTACPDMNGESESFSCSNLDSIYNCGICGNACAEGQTCVGGTCQCPEGQIVCNVYDIVVQSEIPSCINPASDDANCGRCDNPCPSSPKWKPPPNMHYGCVMGSCGASGLNPKPSVKPVNPAPPSDTYLKCDADYADCDERIRPNGCEAQPNSDNFTDDANCGACNNVAPPGKHCLFVDGIVTSSRKGFDCPAGFASCGTNSCDADLGSTSNCGRCGNYCPAGIVARSDSYRVLCVDEACAIECTVPFADCNHASSDACEVNLYTSPENCGSCGNKCLPGQPCVDGACLLGPCEAPK